MINGESFVKFGGQIGFKICGLKEMNEPHIIVGMRELNQIHDVGKHDNKLEGGKLKVVLYFENPKSIDTVIDVLKIAKDNLLEQIQEVDNNGLHTRTNV